MKRGCWHCHVKLTIIQFLQTQQGDAQGDGDNDVMATKVYGLQSVFEQRPAAEAMRVKLDIETYDVFVDAHLSFSLTYS